MQWDDWYWFITGLYFSDNKSRLILVECPFEVSCRCFAITLNDAFTTRRASNASQRCRGAGVADLVAGRSVTGNVGGEQAGKADEAECVEEADFLLYGAQAWTRLNRPCGR